LWVVHIGIFEKYDESVSELFSILYENVNISHTHINKWEKEYKIPTQEEIKLIKKYNKYDIELYNYILDKKI